MNPVLIFVEESQIILQEADLPDVIVDLADAHELLGEDNTEVDFTCTDADTAAAGNAYGAIVIQVMELVQRIIGTFLSAVFSVVASGCAIGGLFVLLLE